MHLGVKPFTIYFLTILLDAEYVEMVVKIQIALVTDRGLGH